MKFKVLTAIQYYLIINLVIFSVYSFAASNKQEVPDNRKSESDTLILSKIMQDLLPLVLDEQQFNNIDNKDIINKNIDKLDSLFEGIKEHRNTVPITFRISSEVLSRHIKAAKRAFVNLEYVENELWPKIGFLPFDPENPSIILVAEFFLIELILKNSKDFNNLTLSSLKEIFENDI